MRNLVVENVAQLLREGRYPEARKAAQNFICCGSPFHDDCVGVTADDLYELICCVAGNVKDIGGYWRTIESLSK